jgi:ABC-type multidrug transport system ATPase subunit
VSDIAIEVEGLKKHFGDVQALKGVDLSVREATVYGLLGPNGAGKTTAVRILTTPVCPDEGRARVAEYDVVKDAERLRHRIGLAGQSAAVDGNLRPVGRTSRRSAVRACCSSTSRRRDWTREVGSRCGT